MIADMLTKSSFTAQQWQSLLKQACVGPSPLPEKSDKHAIVSVAILSQANTAFLSTLSAPSEHAARNRVPAAMERVKLTNSDAWIAASFKAAKALTALNGDIDLLKETQAMSRELDDVTCNAGHLVLSSLMEVSNGQEHHPHLQMQDMESIANYLHDSDGLLRTCLYVPYDINYRTPAEMSELMSDEITNLIQTRGIRGFSDSVLNMGGWKGRANENMRKHVDDIVPGCFASNVWDIHSGATSVQMLANIKRSVDNDPVALGDPSKYKHTTMIFYTLNDCADNPLTEKSKTNIHGNRYIRNTLK